jgi:deazaflavin-dependent oxidoreductase (nitroreductase family)
MPVQSKEIHAPRGFARVLWRLPIWLYRLHLGWLLQQRFLLLTHTGRKSGLPRKTMLEVIHYEKRQQTYTVFSGWGKRSDWVKNVEQTPQVIIQVGKRSFHAQAARPAPEEAEDILLAYARRYPHLIRLFMRFLGYQTDGSEEDMREIARQSVIVTFKVLSACVASRA